MGTENEFDRIDAEHGLYVVLDAEGLIEQFSGDCEALTGYSFDEVEGEPFADIFLEPNEREVVKGFLKHMRPEMFPNRSDYHWVMRTGEKRLYSTLTEAVLDGEGRITRVVCRSIDVDQLSRAEEVFRIILRTAMDGFCINDMTGRLLDINDAYCNMLGYTREELLGINITDVEAVMAPEEIAEHIRVIMETGHDRFEAHHRRKDGTIIEAEASTSYSEVEGGRLYSFIRDISEHKRIESELRQHREELERLVSERTVELETANDLLRQEIAEREQAEKELLRMNKELEGYAQTVSHELRTPLSGIFLALEYLEQIAGKLPAGEIDGEIEAIVDKAKSAVGRAESKVVCLLDLAKAGQVPVEVRELDIADLVESILQELDGELERVRIDIDADLGRVVADPHQVQQVFSNLIVNAVTYCDCEAPLLSVSYAGEDDEGFKHWTVSDNGSGIPEYLMDELFLPFVKGEDGGSGIGLAIVDKIVKVYGGRVRVRNDSGARFELSLRDYPG
jgi:PAS domain S-box-containing protein